MDMRAMASINGDFHRVRVQLVTTKPLSRFVTLSPEGLESMILQVKFEKLPRFCAHCGLMGHTHLECGEGVYSEDELHYGAWMLADDRSWKPGTPRFRSTSSGEKDESCWMGCAGAVRGGRTNAKGARGRGGFGRTPKSAEWREKEYRASDTQASKKRTSTEAGVVNNDDLNDTASSPEKQVVHEKKNDGEKLAAKKQLDMSKDLVLPARDGVVPPPPPVYVPPRERKRSKKDASKDKSPVKNGAGSLEEYRHHQ